MSNSLLDMQPLSRLRRNHGLEHATINVLNEKYPGVKLGGMSTPFGFTIMANLPTEVVAEGAIEALKRLRAGEGKLAMHPNCGTNFAMAGAVAGTAAWLGTLGSGKEFKHKLERLPLIIMLATISLILTRPLGPLMQKYVTTDSDPGGLELERVETAVRAGVRMHRILTRD